MAVRLRAAFRHHWTPGAPEGDLFGGGLGFAGVVPAWALYMVSPAEGPVALATGAALAGDAGAASTATAAPLPPVMAAQGSAASISSGVSAGNLVINVVFDSSVTTNNAPASFEASVNAAVSFFETHLTAPNPVSFTLHVGYGEIGGWGTNVASQLPANALGESSTSGYDYEYRPLYNAFQAAAQSGSSDQVAAFDSLPSNDPTGTNNFFVAAPEAEAFGILTPNTTIDESIGFGDSVAVTWGTTDQVVSTPGSLTYDGFAAIEHEISEVLGRQSEVLANGVGTAFTPLDLFRYSAPDTRDLTGTTSGYFSIDSGTIDLGAFNSVPPGDFGDWSSSINNDAFDATISAGVTVPLSSLDLRVMNVLGYSLSSACFAGGTRILTSRGAIAVEALAPGDLAITRFAGIAPIRWIGHRRLDCARHPEPWIVRPIRVAADAFGPGQPLSPLLLSPEHAVMLDDELIPIRLLVNGGSIAQLTDHDRIVYYHIELDRHDILFAEGLATESYLDAGNRAMFENAETALWLHPPAADAESHRLRVAGSCLPIGDSPTAVEPHWRRLAARSVALGLPPVEVRTTDQPELLLAIGAERLAPVWQAPNRAMFVIPPTTEPIEARLMSRVVVPVTLRPWVEDRRRLGVMVHGITVRNGTTQLDIPLDDPAMTEGWWAVERNATAIWRWTDGAALVRLPPGGGVLEVRLGTGIEYLAVGTGASASRHAA